MSETFSRVQKTIIAVTGSAERDVTKDARLDELGVNSLDIIELGMTLEDEFALMVWDEYLLSSKTVGDLVDTIHNSRGQESDPSLR